MEIRGRDDPDDDDGDLTIMQAVGFMVLASAVLMVNPSDHCCRSSTALTSHTYSIAP